MVITPEKAAMKTPQGTQDMPTEAQEALKFDKSPFQELVYEELGVAVSLDGIESVEGKDAYKLTYALPGGISLNKWYDVESGLCTKITAQGQQITYLSYKTIELQSL